MQYYPQGERLHFASAVGTNGNWYWDYYGDYYWELNKAYTIVIEQKYVMNEVYINFIIESV